ncbi:MAG TPA: septum formation initiator family protein [Chitinispirillaceae bacterium]|jgi:cell division protein FtsL|nr:septum formation initiator family protein [Fibrobacter sp.]HLV33313.1 septum formation initiator family protein [Chitinispirillaceae bacterium]
MKINRYSLRYLFLLIVAILLFSLIGDHGFITLYKSNKQIKNLKTEIEYSQNIIDSLKTEIDRLKHDTSFIEKIAREKYGMAKENEKIIKFVEESE